MASNARSATGAVMMIAAVVGAAALTFGGSEDLDRESEFTARYCMEKTGTTPAEALVKVAVRSSAYARCMSEREEQLRRYGTEGSP
ncbi:hypothetical protein [Streptomyces sp. NPDC048188]|uniref:hypothetical protein n=1 Tax=Streptomyces sp. NPDC048188 TaxID=3155749 RepID=UPI003416BEC3